jgi:ribulose bisphosphate carboxylase small subunit
MSVQKQTALQLHKLLFKNYEILIEKVKNEKANDDFTKFVDSVEVQLTHLMIETVERFEEEIEKKFIDVYGADK